jgi:hypothetical protein
MIKKNEKGYTPRNFFDYDYLFYSFRKISYEVLDFIIVYFKKSLPKTNPFLKIKNKKLSLF